MDQNVLQVFCSGIPFDAHIREPAVVTVLADVVNFYN
jgi:hypothetical protein